MAKIAVNKEGVAPELEAVVDERQKLWDEFVQLYKEKNPVKYAQKVATTWIDPITGRTIAKPNEFAVIPPSFKGKVKIEKLPNGQTRRVIL